MKILVTGGSGFIGSHVVDRLVDAGHRVTVLDLKKPYRDDIRFVKGAITSKRDVAKSVKGAEAIYHLAAVSDINLVKDNPIETIESNILSTAYLLEEARKRKVERFILASSVYVYNERGHIYTTCKLASEMLCKNYHTLYSLPYTILRYGTAYGPRSRGVDVVSIFVEKALNNEKIVIHSSGNQKRNFIYVEDMALGSVAALKGIAKNKTYAIAGTESISIKELADMVKRHVNNRVEIKIDASKERKDDYRGEVEGLETTMVELKWHPKINLAEGIKQYRDWYLACKNGAMT